MRQFDRRLLYHFDWLLVVLVFSLVCLGICTQYSASYGVGSQSSGIVVRQLTWALLGLAAMLVALSFDYHYLERHAYLVYGLCVLSLLAVAEFGSVGGGARRWISFAGLSLQPSEFVKLGLVVVLAHYWSRARSLGRSTLWDFLAPALLFAPAGALIAAQPDLGTVVTLAIVLVSVALFAGLRIKDFAKLAIVAAAAIPFLWAYLEPYQKERVTVFFNPEMDPLGAGYHIIQSKIAIGSGTIFGKGFLNGTQSQLHFLPEQHTDFIFSVFAEEWGFVGALVLLSLYLALIGRGLLIAMRAKDRFGSLLAFGVSSIIFWQTVINIGMALGALPVVGITLPFFSYGGSSLTVMMIGAGLLINVSTRRFTF